jgi:hypothetical protein
MTCSIDLDGEFFEPLRTNKVKSNLSFIGKPIRNLDPNPDPKLLTKAGSGKIILGPQQWFIHTGIFRPLFSKKKFIKLQQNIANSRTQSH